MTRSAYHPKRTPVGILIAVIVIVAAIVAGWLYVRHAEYNPLSEEATLTANVVNVAATVAGRVVRLDVRDNQRVSSGDLLFSLDPESYQLAVAQIKADLRLAEATRDAQRRTIDAEQLNAAVAAEQVNRARTNLALAEKSLARLVPLERKGYATSQQVDVARTARDDAQTSLRQSLSQAAAAEALVTSLDASQALVEARRAALAIAEHQLAATQVRAPHDGVIVGLHVSTGEVVAPGQSLFTLIDTRHWYASATFPETELSRIAVGDCATVYVLSDRSRPIRGRVDSMGWGVVSENILNLPRGLPYVPKSLNWVQIAQRFPVRIVLEDPPPALMRIGASAVTVIRHGEPCASDSNH